jgi:hypothetical protein
MYVCRLTAEVGAVDLVTVGAGATSVMLGAVSFFPRLPFVFGAAGAATSVLVGTTVIHSMIWRSSLK